MESGATTSIETYLEDGLILYGLGKFVQAYEKWRKALDLDPKSKYAAEYLEILKEDLPDVEIKTDASSAQRMPNESSHLALSEIVAHGIEMLENGNPENAFKALRDAIKAGADTPDVFGFMELARAARIEYYRKRIPDTNKIPKVIMEYELIKNLNLTKEEGFILSLVDGLISYDDIMSLTRMDKLDAMGILASLLLYGVVKAE